MQKLLKYCQTTMNISRRDFTKLIDSGTVLINWNKVESYSQTIKNWEELTINWKTDVIKLKQQQKQIVLFNKPEWLAVSKKDKHNETIYSILPKEFENFYYIGRLDKNSCGLLLLTNSPELVNEMSHPSKEVEKEYLVKIHTSLKVDEFKAIDAWIRDEDELLEVKKIQKLWWNQYQIILNQGKKRHIRRIFRQLKKKIISLQRVREWKYKLWEIKEWEFKLKNI